MAGYKYAKGQIANSSQSGVTLPAGNVKNKDGILEKDLRAYRILDDSLFNSVGLYSKEEIEEARFTKYSRFGRVLDPYGRLNPGREYLFFVKPDLHIVIPNGDTKPYGAIYEIGNFTNVDVGEPIHDMVLNPQLQENPYFMNLLLTHPNVIQELQFSAGNKLRKNRDPFIHSLSFGVISNLPLDSVSMETLDNPSTVFGTSYKYVRDSEASDENYSFSLEFVDNKNLDIYHFFKAYSEYHIARKSGFVTPPSLDFYRYKRLHNTMGIYKFVVAEDMETIIYWAYLWGVYPTSVPRDAFQDPSFPDGNGLTFTVSFEAAFIEDMNPMILNQFNSLMRPYLKAKGCNNVNNWLPTTRQNLTEKYIWINGVQYLNPSYDSTISPIGGKADIIDGTLPIGALVDGRKIGDEKQQKYRLRWYAPNVYPSSELSNWSYDSQSGKVYGIQNGSQMR